MPDKLDPWYVKPRSGTEGERRRPPDVLPRVRGVVTWERKCRKRFWHNGLHDWQQ